MKTPLSVIVVRQGSLADSEPFVMAIRKALIGCEALDSYTAIDYELLNPVDLRVFSWPGRERDPEKMFLMPNEEKKIVSRDSGAVLVVLLVASAGDAEVRRMIHLWGEFSSTRPQCRVLIVALDRAKALPIPTKARTRRLTSLGLDDLDERDLRRDLLSLHVLHHALRLLTPEASKPRSASGKAGRTNTRPRLFFSHAKRDGVPLSTSLVSWIKRLKGFDFFYDTINLDLSGNLSEQLEQAIGSSVLIVLRTEVFDQRYWCQTEVYWAEKHGVPVVAVDARWNVKHAPSVVALDSSPSVRIPDGSLIRILHGALEEALRVALHRARASLAATEARLTQSSWVALSRYPSLVSLESAAETRRRGNRKLPRFFVVYPNPAMPSGLRDSASVVCERLMPGSKLVSLDEFRIHCLSLNR